MYIYKITNLINNKVYIGQVYNKTVQDRFSRHIHEANPKHPMYIDRAIHKYGKENFKCEQIDVANNLMELNEKEKYWIKYYNSTDLNKGYNLTPGGEGGNTYLNKSSTELKIIGDKISKALSGSNNGMARKIKCLNTITNQEIIFNTVKEAANYFGIKNNNIISERCNHKLKCLYKKIYNFAYIEDDYVPLKKETKSGRNTIVYITNKSTNETLKFESINDTCKFYNVNICAKIPQWFSDTYTIKIVPHINNVKSVSTIPDECKEVGSEISTDSKRKTID